MKDALKGSVGPGVIVNESCEKARGGGRGCKGECERSRRIRREGKEGEDK